MSVIFTAVIVVVVVGILITYEISHKLTQNVKLAVQAQMSKGLTAQLGIGRGPEEDCRLKGRGNGASHDLRWSIKNGDA